MGSHGSSSGNGGRKVKREGGREREREKEEPDRGNKKKVQKKPRKGEAAT
jgi:hypothetical protein